MCMQQKYKRMCTPKENTVNFNILKNDLKRKKSINVILFLFIILASMLMAGSVNVLYTTSTAISRMMVSAHVPDLSILAYDNPTTNKQIEDWAGTSDKAASIQSDKVLLLMSDSFYSDTELIMPKDKTTTVLLTAIPKDHSLVFDQKDQPIELGTGEIAIPMAFHKTYNVNIGDTMSIHVDDTVKDFTVAAYQKDVFFGSDMIMKRFVINDADFAAYWAISDASMASAGSSELIKTNFWAVETAGGVSYREVAGEFGNQSINVLFSFGTDVINTSYMVARLVAVVMIIVSLCLILISFLILRFTIVFTIQEDYREIGVMKAIGIRNAAIRRLYLVKYFVISLAGGLIGFAVSFLYAAVMLQSVSDLFITQRNAWSILLSLASSALVVATSMIFCYLYTGKINKVSVIDAIHQGNTGERFSKSKKIRLSSHSLMNVSDFLSLSDLMNGFKKFAVLTITFIIGTMLIIVPLNIINTLKDADAMLDLFGLPPFDISVASDKLIASAARGDFDGLDTELANIESLFAKEGYTADFHLEMTKAANLYVDNPDDSLNVSAWQGRGYPTQNYLYMEGTAPVLKNEIAISSKIAEYFGLSIGDSVTCNLQEESKTFIVTALYQSMMNQGSAVRLSEDYPLTLDGFSNINFYGKFADDSTDAAAAKTKLQQAFPDLILGTSEDQYNVYLGGTVQAVDSMKNMIVAVVLGIIFLITCLIVRMLISREIAEIAMLKSLGFRRGELRRWQIGRIVIILIVSITAGTILSGTLGSSLVAGVFSMMGATSVPLIIVPLQVYLIYPALLLASTILAAAVSVGQIKKTQIWEVNNQE